MSVSPEPDNVPPLISLATEWGRGLWSHQVVRFLVVGAGNALFGYAVYLFGLWIGLLYQMALICSTILGAIFNFFTTGQIVFENHKLTRIVGFLAIYGIMLVINLALLTVLVGCGVAKAYAQLILLPAIVALSFVLNKYLVFGRDS